MLRKIKQRVEEFPQLNTVKVIFLILIVLSNTGNIDWPWYKIAFVPLLIGIAFYGLDKIVEQAEKLILKYEIDDLLEGED